MDRLTTYQILIKRLLTEFSYHIDQNPTPGLDTELIFDEERDNYMLVTVGWSPQGRVRNPTLYVRIRNSKFWIEVDWSEEGIATDLLEAGVPKEDIVLAFHPPDMRPYTEFAVA